MRILLITHRLPFPPNKGDKIRSYNILRHLADHHDVHVACPIDSAQDQAMVPELEKQVSRVASARVGAGLGRVLALRAVLYGRSISVTHFYSRELQRRIDALIDEGPYDAYFCFSSPMAEYLIRSRHAHGALRGALRIMDFIDIDSHKWSQYAAESPRWKAWIYRHEARTLAAYERRVEAEFDASLVVTEAERHLFPGGASDRLVAMNNGVDLEFFSPLAPAPKTAAPTIVFTGVMDYWPNVDGVCWFAEFVWPSVRRHYPTARFLIVGSSPSAAVRRLAREPGIEVTGFVKDVRSYVREATLCVAPLRIARGVQNKVLEAMAMARAVVVSAQAFEGLRAAPGRDLAVSPCDEAFAAAVLALLRDDAGREAMGRAARGCVEFGYSWASNLAVIDRLVMVGQRQAAAAVTAS